MLHEQKGLKEWKQQLKQKNSVLVNKLKIWFLCLSGKKSECELVLINILFNIFLEIQLIHVATYGPNDQKPQYHLQPNRSTHKVSLDAYREASKNIFKIFHRHCDKIQKIGLDEGYMDMTDKVNEIILQEYVPRYLDKLDDEICGIPIHWEELGITIKNDDNDDDNDNDNDNDNKQDQSIPPTTTWSDLQLAIGAKISNQIRKEIFDELHYTCSAGIKINENEDEMNDLVHVYVWNL